MKNFSISKYTLIIIALSTVCLLITIFNLSCSSTSGLSKSKSNSWNGNKVDKMRTLSIRNITADTPNGAYSTEREISALLPLLFLERKFFFPENNLEADFIVDVLATERDYLSGWKTKKSISLEVMLYRNKSGRKQIGNTQISNSSNSIEIQTPVAAGRTTAIGVEGFSSSKNLESILRSTIKKAASVARKTKI